jgi:predicted GIY-YIG superfamily endonuclease
VSLVYAEFQPDRGAAMRRERSLKQLATRRKRELILACGIAATPDREEREPEDRSAR